MLSLRHSAIPLDNVLGPWFLGVVVSSIIFGITSLQVYGYYTRFSSRDPLFLKIFVAALCALQTFHLALLIMSYYAASVTNFGDYVGLGIEPWSLRAQVVVGAVLATLVQTFYAYRIWTLSGKSEHRYMASGLPAFIVSDLSIPYENNQKFLQLLFSAGELAMSIAYTVKISPNLTRNPPDIAHFIISGLSLEMICNLLITGGIVTNLRKSRSKFERSNRVINILIVYIVNSNALTL
ncbi:hypothetical protein R3P38DRAFT_950741 [Favolaschia claudopus]|uniref:Uncharacterized protein n=1 Tax=Favolaschia claudopus TaxID=2862362 RepID=A0AAW0BMA3_9AGAR